MKNASTVMFDACCNDAHCLASKCSSWTRKTVVISTQPRFLQINGNSGAKTNKTIPGFLIGQNKAAAKRYAMNHLLSLVWACCEFFMGGYQVASQHLDNFISLIKISIAWLQSPFGSATWSCVIFDCKLPTGKVWRTFTGKLCVLFIKNPLNCVFKLFCVFSLQINFDESWSLIFCPHCNFAPQPLGSTRPKQTQSRRNLTVTFLLENKGEVASTFPPNNLKLIHVIMYETRFNLFTQWKQHWSSAMVSMLGVTSQRPRVTNWVDNKITVVYTFAGMLVGAFKFFFNYMVFIRKKVLNNVTWIFSEYFLTNFTVML